VKLQLNLIKSLRVTRSLVSWRDDYLDSKQVRLEPSTRNNYKRAINLYIQYVGENHWPPTRIDVIQYLDDVKKRASQTTASSYWTILRAWFNYMAELEAFGRSPNPAEEIVRLKLAPKLPKKSRKGIPKKHIDALFVYLFSLPDSLTKHRDLALLRFLYRTGARSGEAARLTTHILVLEMNHVCISAEEVKDDEDRELFFGEKVKANLTKWLARLSDYGYKGIWVFPSTRGQKPLERPLTVSGINQMFHRRLKQAGLPMYRVHDLRHTFTKEAIRQGKSLSSLQRQLGHATPDMVLWYAKTFSEEQKEEFSNFGDDE
jgi:site-specific recombinase XerD